MASSLNKSAAAVEKDIPPVIADTRARPDFSDKALTDLVASLEALSQDMLSLEASKDPSQAVLWSTQSASQTAVIGLTDLVNKNTAMSKMGQLNTDRIIPPTTLEQNNKNLNTLIGGLQALVAQLQADSEAMPAVPKFSAGKSSVTVEKQNAVNLDTLQKDLQKAGVSTT